MAVGRVTAAPAGEWGTLRAPFASMDICRRAQGEILGALGFGLSELVFRVVDSGTHWRLRDYADPGASPAGVARRRCADQAALHLGSLPIVERHSVLPGTAPSRLHARVDASVTWRRKLRNRRARRRHRPMRRANFSRILRGTTVRDRAFARGNAGGDLWHRGSRSRPRPDPARSAALLRAGIKRVPGTPSYRWSLRDSRKRTGIRGVALVMRECDGVPGHLHLVEADGPRAQLL